MACSSLNQAKKREKGNKKENWLTWEDGPELVAGYREHEHPEEEGLHDEQDGVKDTGLSDHQLLDR